MSGAASVSAKPFFAMAYLTSAPLDAADAIRLAARLGYDGVGLRIAPSTHGGGFTPLIQRPELLRETQAVLTGEGVKVSDIEIIRIGPQFRAADHVAFLATCAALGAPAVLVVADDPDESRLTESFAALCDLAAPHGVSINLEFMSFTQVKSASAAHRLVERAGRANGAVLVDALHVARTASTLDDLRAIPRAHLNYWQICDAPPGFPATEAEIIHTAREARLLPGEGGIDLAGIAKALPPDLPISIELPNASEKARLGVEDWARRCLEASRRVMAWARG
jgi:sugar phosphate isomerase/epimerase